MGQDDQTVMIAQIEEPQGVDEVDAIAATPGIDGILLGQQTFLLATARLRRTARN